MFDVNFVLENYGLHGVLFEIAFIEVANAFLLRDAVADPCPLFHGVLKGKRSLGKFATLLGFQFVAAYFSFLVARTFWRMGLHPQHIDMWQSEQCSADLTVTILYGSIVEAIGLISSKVAEKFFERRLLSSNQTTLACALTSGLITVLGIHLTGMYANPIVAWACTFNCGEVSHVSHFVVYWLAPFSAYTLTDLLLKDEDDEGERETVKESDKKLD
ncbi:aquaporin-11 [Ditylenchus destructor]|nr:aquaporin-11 [Ditylenchus destructor]